MYFPRQPGVRFSLHMVDFLLPGWLFGRLDAFMHSFVDSLTIHDLRLQLNTHSSEGLDPIDKLASSLCYSTTYDVTVLKNASGRAMHPVASRHSKSTDQGQNNLMPYSKIK